MHVQPVLAALQNNRSHFLVTRVTRAKNNLKTKSPTKKKGPRPIKEYAMTIMNKVLCVSCMLTYSLSAEVGCMDNSYHLGNLNDPKNMYYVAGSDGGPCSCPCSRYCLQYRCSLRHGQCPVCKHYRIPRPLIIVRKHDTQHKVQQTMATDTRTFNMFRLYRVR
jgi:hypothetical protein